MPRRRQPAFSTRTQQLDGHQLVLLEGGKELFPALVESMDAARRVVHLETYIFEFKGMALEVAQALERAAQRGVLVRLVVDGVGTPSIPVEWRMRFAAAGVLWRTYAPLGSLGLLIPSRWRRLHRKLCVIDETVGFCGGINIIDDLDDVALGRLIEPRLDFSLRVAGPLVDEMVATMESLWWRLQALRKARQREFRTAWNALRETLPEGDFSRILGLFGSAEKAGEQGGADADNVGTAPGSLGVNGAVAALLLRDNLTHRHDIERAYLKAIGEARHDIVIANAYFVPGRKLRRALTVAAQRGVRVRLLVQGRYENFFQFHAARPVHHTLVAAGIEILEYAPSALHAKVAVVDQRWATVGSTNLDPLSLLLAREANVLTTDERFAAMLYQRLDSLVTNHGRAIDPASLAMRPLGQRILDRLAFAVMRVVLFVTGHRY
ncbi:cardiolipin synthase B [Hydrogenophaga crassostreae]|uniref:Cardiolipin synthase B n=1 Tax=Hydrogenophaga crassostreae TaxID=1763535 RepID=A0A167I9C8_9BURK|nr:cardiolipin synthase ClsB [Hydrogenophaga crassostreae]AOW12336.1 cardiolipin synthase B [Hydrogenophaga crassostreae]OAD42386.1 cardiolipin synthase B [Hydrogenophaga crassostreae]